VVRSLDAFSSLENVLIRVSQSSTSSHVFPSTLISLLTSSISRLTLAIFSSNVSSCRGISSRLVRYDCPFRRAINVSEKSNKQANFLWATCILSVYAFICKACACSFNRKALTFDVLVLSVGERGLNISIGGFRGTRQEPLTRHLGCQGFRICLVDQGPDINPRLRRANYVW